MREDDIKVDIIFGGLFKAAMPLLKKGAKTLEREALAGIINVVLYAEFDNVIEIDRNRQVLFDYSA